MKKKKDEIIDNLQKTKNLHLDTIKQLKSKDLELLIQTQSKKNLEKQYDNLLDEKKQLYIKLTNTNNSLKKIQGINYEKDNQIIILNNKNNILKNEIQILENDKQNTENDVDELILKLEQSEQLDRIKSHKITKLNNKILELKTKNLDISEKMKISQNRTINLLVQNNEDLDNKVYKGIKREKRLLDTIKLLNQFKHKIKFEGNGKINKIENKIIKLNKENDSYYKELQYQISLKDTEINDLKRNLFISQSKYNNSKKNDKEKEVIIKEQNEKIKQLIDSNKFFLRNNNEIKYKINSKSIYNYNEEEYIQLLDKLKNINMKLKIDLENAKTEESNLINILKQNEEQIEEFKDNLFNVSKNINSIDYYFNIKENEYINKNELKLKENEINKLQIEIDKLKIEIRKEEENCTNIERDIRKQKLKISNMNDDYEDQSEFYKNKIIILQNNFEDLEKKINKNKNINNKEIYELKEVLGELETKQFVDNNRIKEQKEIKFELYRNYEYTNLEEKRLKRDFENMKKGNFKQIEIDRIEDEKEDRKNFMKK